MRRMLAAALLALALGRSEAAPPRGMTAIPSGPVSTASGPVAGTLLPSGVKAWLGIPFAEPPVGALRWAPPRPTRWTGTWNADRLGPECIQVLRPHDINHYFGEEPTSENCLYLNIWVPRTARPGAKLPVIAFIYGGGFTIGSSGMANYGGEAVARAGAIFVSFNYRVGALGFMAHPELSREQGGHSGNYGLMDQQAALRWVRANIARFGGDPRRVLIIGQSAGAASVAAHLFSPASRGLFSAAAMLSGCNFTSDGPSLAEAEKIGRLIQDRIGAASLRALRDLPADRILAIQTESQVGARIEGVRVNGPIVDGFVLPRGKAEAIAAGAVAPVPILAAWTSDDIDIPTNPISRARSVGEFREAAKRLYGEAADEFLSLYPVARDADVPAIARRAARTAGFEAGARFCARAQAARAPAWLAEFDRKHPYVPGVRIADQDVATIGAYHTADVPYWLGTLDAYNWQRPTRAWTEWDRQLSRAMLRSLIALAATGRAAAPGLDWTAWSPANERKLVLGDSAHVEPLDAARLDWHARHPVPTAFDSRPGRPRD
jgi:para-nitrobenzyl esterase